MASALAAELGSFSGVVHDANGNPLAGVKVTIASKLNPAEIKEMTTNSKGEYAFHSLLTGDYQLTAGLSGYAVASIPVIHIESAEKPAVADLVLTAAPKPPQFQAAGIHGLIDPGGYSAAANSDAATGVLRGIADVQRNDHSAEAIDANKWPCDRQPELERALAAHPDDVAAVQHLGQFYLAHDQLQKATPLLERAWQLDPKDRELAQTLSIARIRNGQFEEARRLLTSLISDEAKSEVGKPQLHQLLALADEGSGLFKLAAQQYAIAEKQAPSEDSLFGEGYETLLDGSAKDALVIFETGVQKYPRSIPFKVGTGTAYFLTGQLAEAVNSFLQAIDLDPEDARPYPFLSAASALSREQGDRVLKAFKRYADQQPSRSTALYLYALTLSRQNDEADRATIESLLKQAILLDANNAKAHLLLADTYFRRNDYNAAVYEYTIAIQLAPDLSEAHYRLAKAYKRVGNTEQANQQMQVFQKTRTAYTVASNETGMAESPGIDIAQFVSVMNVSKQSAGAETQCGQSAH